MPFNIATETGSLIEQKVDAIVIDWMPNFFAPFRFFQSKQMQLIRKCAGREVTRELVEHWPLLNKAACTGAGNLPFRGIIHVDSSGFISFLATETSIRSAVRSALHTASEKGYKTIAFPLLGEGIRLCSEIRVFEIMRDEIRQSHFWGDAVILVSSALKDALDHPKTDERKSISIYYRNGVLFFVPDADGGFCKTEDFSKRIQIDDNASDQEKGETFWKTVNIAGEKIPYHDWRDGPRPETTAFLKETNIKTWATFTKHALNLSATWNKTKKKLLFLSLKYKHGGYYATKDDPHFEIPDSSTAEVIGKTIDTALHHCVGQGGRKKGDIVPKNESSEESACNAINFGYKTCWLAIKNGDMKEVAIALGIKKTHEVDWEMGIDESYQNSVFITPPIGEWILVAGSQLSDSEMELLSQKFGEVQSFGTHRGSNVYFWSRAIDGKIVRFFSVSDDGVEERGIPTPIEQSLIDFADEDFSVNIDEDMVMRIAGDWSVDPMELESREGIAPSGLSNRHEKIGHKS
ncbi:MAG: macro domain-containing protein [Thermoguttaceae bacterium]